MSAFDHSGKAVDVKRAARELGVRYMLEGSVRKGGDRVRITAQLIDAATGNHIWGPFREGRRRFLAFSIRFSAATRRLS
jgi:TolB-like protein